MELLNGDSFIAGSGVLIDPYWVLTAGHVTLDELSLPWVTMEFNPSANVGANLDRFVDADMWFHFPGYDSDITPGKGDDIGLVRLSQPILDVTPATRFYGQDEVGVEMIMAGYGKPSVWPNGNNEPFDGIRRAGRNIAESHGGVRGLVEEQMWLAEFDRFQILGGSPPLPLEWAISSGDSGGGWFSEIDGVEQLVGISGFFRGNHNVAGAIRVSLYNDWIDQTMAANPTNSVPEPTTALLFSLGLLGFGAKGRNRKKV